MVGARDTNCMNQEQAHVMLCYGSKLLVLGLQRGKRALGGCWKGLFGRLMEGAARMSAAWK